MLKTKEIVVFVAFASIGLLINPLTVLAEQCVDGVAAMAPWTKSIRNDRRANAKRWPDIARSQRFTVDHTPENGAVLVYPETYGNGIDKTNGHVALIINKDPDKKGKITIKDSNGICGGDRRQCQVSAPNWNNVWVIHPR